MNFIKTAKADALEFVKINQGAIINIIMKSKKPGSQDLQLLLSDYVKVYAAEKEQSMLSYLERKDNETLEFATALLEQLSEYDDTNSGLWSSKEPDHIRTINTYANAVRFYIIELAETISNRVNVSV